MKMKLEVSGRFLSREDELATMLEPAGGHWAVVIEDLDGKGSVRLNPDDSFAAASVIKIPIMMTAFHEARAGNLRMDDAIILRKEDKVGGAGVLREFHNGLQLTILDAIHMMIVVSDNTATNLVMDRVGRETVNAYMARNGVVSSQLEARLMRPKPEGPWNRLTAHDVALLVKGMVDRTIENPEDCDTMLEIMGRQQYNDKLPRYLPKEAMCAHKTGEDRGVTHDAGVITGPKARFVIVCLSQRLEDTRLGNDVIAKVAKWAYDILSAE
jgi:beta-lactamase class A